MPPSSQSIFTDNPLQKHTQVCCYPAYQSLYELALSTGCSLRLWEPTWDAAAGRLRFDVTRLASLVAGGDTPGDAAASPVRLIVVNLPHNPTGETLSQQEQAAVVAVAQAAGAYLFSDEMYWRSGEWGRQQQYRCLLANRLTMYNVRFPHSVVLLTDWLIVHNTQ